jgi:uncharacterized protein HemX
MNSALQNCPDVFKLNKPLSSFPVRGRIVTLFTAAIALTLAISLVYGCAKENKDLGKLQEENRALKEKIASLETQTNESQTKPAVTSKPEMEEELLVLARKLKASPNDFVGQQIKLHLLRWTHRPEWERNRGASV